MAIELQVTSVTALVTSEPRERQIYDGRGDDRRVKGRFVDGAGRPVSVVSAVVVADPVGLLPDAQVQLLDIQMSGLVPGAMVRIEGTTTVRLTGGDYAAIRATVTGERIARSVSGPSGSLPPLGAAVSRPRPGRPDMASGVTAAAVLQGLRWWAQGALPDQAAVELLAGSSGGRLMRPGVPWVRPCRRPGWFWLDADALTAHAATLPDGAQREVLLLAALLVDGDTVTRQQHRSETRRAAA